MMKLKKLMIRDASMGLVKHRWTNKQVFFRWQGDRLLFSRRSLTHKSPKCMEELKRQRLENAGWSVGNAEDFLYSQTEVNHIRELQQGDLLTITPMTSCRGFSSALVYEVKDVNQHGKYSDIDDTQDFAVLYIYDKTLNSSNPKLFASNTPIFESEINHSIKVQKYE
jgi:hypothetical protein